MRDTNTDDSGQSNRLKALEYGAQATTIGALVLTYVLQSYTIEANPGAAVLLELLGYPLVAALSVATLALAYGLFRRLASDGTPVVLQWFAGSYPRSALAGAVGLYSLGLIDVAVNVWRLSSIGIPESIYWSTVGSIVGSGVGAYLAIRLISQAEIPSLERWGEYRQQSTALALSGLIILSTVSGLLVVGSVGVDPVTASTSTSQDFEDGTAPYFGDSNVKSNPESYPGGGSKSVYFSGNGQGPAVDVSNFNMSGVFYTVSGSSAHQQLGPGGDTGDRIVLQADHDKGFQLVCETNDEIVGTGKIGTVNSDTWYKFELKSDGNEASYTVWNATSGNQVASDSTTDPCISDATGKSEIDVRAMSGNGIYLDKYTASKESLLVNGTVTDSNGNSLDGATVEITQSGSSVTSTSTASDGSYNANLESGDYKVTAKKSGYVSETQSISVSGSAVTGVDFSLSENAVSGTVVSQTGDPISGATVQVYGINYSHPDISGSSDKDAKARDLLTSYAEAVPDSWEKSLDVENKFSSANGNYVAVTANGADDKRWLSSGDLGDPQIQVPADESLVLTAWDPSKTGGVLGQNEWDEELPGSSLKSESIVVEQIGSGGSVLSSETLSLDKTVEESALDQTVLHYARADLNPGFYRVYPESNKESAYVVKVGSFEDAATASTTQAIKPNFTAADGSPAESSKAPSDALSSDKMVLKTVTTDENGEFSAQLPNNVETAGVQVIGSRPGEIESGSSGSDPCKQIVDCTVGGYEDVRNLDSENLTSSSFVVSSAPRVVEVPQGGLEITAYELSSAPFEDVSDQLNKSEWREDLLNNLSYSDLPTALQDNLSTVDRSELEDLHNQMDNLTRENDRLESRLQSILSNETGDQNESIELHINSSDANRTELLTRIGALQEAIESVEDTVETGEGESSTSGETLSWSKPFDTELEADNVLVRAHYTNGTTEVLSTDSEYVRIDERVGRGDEVVIEDLPLGEAAGAGVEINVATEDGTGESQKQFENPSYSGDFPALSSVSLSSTRPGPSETVSLKVNPESGAPFDKIESVEVRAPNGSQLKTTSITGPNTLQFETNGSGTYRVRTVFATPNGKNHTLVQQIPAGSESVELPATVRIKSSPYGSLAVVGDGLSGGSAELEDSGTRMSITAVVPEGEEAPSEIEIHATDQSLPADARISLRVARGPARESLGKHVETTVHLGGMSEETLVYRNGDPLEDDSKYGTIRRSAGSSTIKTHTDDQGTLTIRRNSDPSIVERASFFVETRLPDISSAGIGLLGLVGGSSSLVVGVLPLVGVLAVGNRRWRS